MKYCKKCHVYVPETRSQCPLCQAALFPSPDASSPPDFWDQEEVFPVIPTFYHKYNLLFRVMIFVSILIGVVATVLNMLLFTDSWWSLFVLAGIAAIWVTVAMATRKRSSFSKQILYQVVTLSLILLFFDWLTGWHLWAIDFVIPGLCVCATLAISIMAIIMHQRIQDFVIYLVVNALFGFIPVVFILTGWADIIWPSVVCIAISLLSLSGLILFAGKDTRSELKKRLHI